jgi:hypothetical protein
MHEDMPTVGLFVLQKTSKNYTQYVRIKNIVKLNEAATTGKGLHVRHCCAVRHPNRRTRVAAHGLQGMLDSRVVGSRQIVAMALQKKDVGLRWIF